MNKNRFKTSYLGIILLSFIALAMIGCNNQSNSENNSDAEVTTTDTMTVDQGTVSDSITNIDRPDSLPDLMQETDTQTVKVEVSGDNVVDRPIADVAASIPASMVDGINPGEKVVYLTFDDGPSELTPQILNILNEYGVHATFFVTAQFPKSLHYLTDIANQGSVVAAHSYTHQFSIYSSFNAYFDDLNKINNVIQKYTGQRTRIIRFPGGSSNTAFRHHNPDLGFMKKLCKAVADSGYQYVDWNLSSDDATGNNRPVPFLLSHACSTKQAQYCLLMHDTGAKKTTVEALPAIIKYYKEHGYKFGVINSTSYIMHHPIP